MNADNVRKNKELYRELGQKFYEWHENGELILNYGNANKNLEIEIERLSTLIEYVKDKRKKLK